MILKVTRMMQIRWVRIVKHTEDRAGEYDESDHDEYPDGSS